MRTTPSRTNASAKVSTSPSATTRPKPPTYDATITTTPAHEPSSAAITATAGTEELGELQRAIRNRIALRFLSAPEAARREPHQLAALRAAGFNLDKLQAIDREAATTDRELIDKIHARYSRNTGFRDPHFAAKAAAVQRPVSLFRIVPSLVSTVSGTLTPLDLDSDLASLPVTRVEGTVRQGFRASAFGEGSGWNFAFGDEVWGAGGVSWRFTFIPPTTRFFTLSTEVYHNGHYIIFSDDDWWNSKESSIALYGGWGLTQVLPNTTWNTAYLPTPWGQDDIFFLEDDNIKADSALQGSLSLQGSALLYGGLPVTVDIWINATVKAKGDGSCADLNFTAPGEGIDCPFLNVE